MLHQQVSVNNTTTTSHHLTERFHWHWLSRYSFSGEISTCLKILFDIKINSPLPTGNRVENLSPAMGRGIDSRNRVWNWVAKLYRLAGRYDNPMPTWFLAPIAGLKLPSQKSYSRVIRKRNYDICVFTPVRTKGWLQKSNFILTYICTFYVNTG
jgi:hypothetical protein